MCVLYAMKIHFVAMRHLPYVHPLVRHQKDHQTLANVFVTLAIIDHMMQVIQMLSSVSSVALMPFVQEMKYNVTVIAVR